RVLRFEEKGKDVARRLFFILGNEASAPGNDRLDDSAKKLFRGTLTEFAETWHPLREVEKIERIKRPNCREIARDRRGELVQIPPKAVRKNGPPKNVERHACHFDLHIHHAPIAKPLQPRDEVEGGSIYGLRERADGLGREKRRERAPLHAPLFVLGFEQ